MPQYVTSALLLVVSLFAFLPPSTAAQPPTPLLVAPRTPAGPGKRPATARRSRKARINALALNDAQIELQLFDDVQVTVKRKKLKRLSEDRMVWVGADEYGAQAVLTMARGVLTGTVFVDNRTFEITLDADGDYSVVEIASEAYPTDDPEHDEAEAAVPDAADLAAGAAGSAAAGTSLDGTPTVIDVMIVWTPKAELDQGGPAAMASLALSAVANANLVYANSGVNAELNLVHSGLVTYTENPSSISTDLTALKGTTDGKMDNVHTLRNAYGADLVTLIGSGYRGAGTCGIAGVMITVSTSFATNAFNIVDRTCAVGNLSYAHEVGHNQGLHHDPANASSTSSYPYAYGYQDPSGYFRTALSYGSSSRVPYLSNPMVSYSGLPTGTPGQDNARALRNNLSTIAAFRSTAGSTAGSPSCTYAVSTTLLKFGSSANTKSLSVTAPTGCAWNVSLSGTASWVTVSTMSGTGNGVVKITTSANTGPGRSTSLTVATKSVTIKQRTPSL